MSAANEAFPDKTLAPVKKRPSDVEENDNSIWSLYLERTNQYDTNRLARWSSDMDVLLIFVSRPRVDY